MKVGLKTKCPGCGLSTAFRVKRPGLRASLVERVKCENCQSHLLVRVEQINRVEARVQVRAIEPSAYLNAIFKEVKEHANGTDGSDEPRSDA